MNLPLGVWALVVLVVVLLVFAAISIRQFAREVAEEGKLMALAPLDAQARWKLNVAITLMESALFELQHLAANHDSIVKIEAEIFRSVAVARRILAESRRAHGSQAEEGTGRRTGSRERGD
jgi:hypothetical protein